MRVSLSRLPSQAALRSIELDRLDGGLNIFDEEGRLAANQSPAMKNLIWRDGALASRRGQRLVYETGKKGLAAHERLFEGRAIFHAGDAIYALDPATSEAEGIYTGLEEKAGAFFLYGGELYYKNPGAYIRIRRDGEGLSAGSVEPYVPVTLINADPATGAGDAYQPENRLTGLKTVWYAAAKDTTEYHLPVTGASIERVEADGAATADFSYDGKSVVTLGTAAQQGSVRITYLLENEAAYKSIMDCRFACAFGGGTRICIVMAGAGAQPDAYFWNGNHAAMDAGYFPMPQYNVCGGEITGFGRQQGMLAIFTAAGVGRAALSLTEIDGREYIQLPYAQINDSLGCDMPGSIRLVENNLVFCSKKAGVYRLLDSSAALENNLQHISRSVDGGELRGGLLADAAAGDCASMDDGARYWLAANGSVYLWDYSVSTAAKPSWFLLTNVHAAAFVREGRDIWFISPDGRICRFYDGFTDFGAGIEREFRFAALSMGGYERLKDVEKVILTVSSTTDCVLNLEYISDQERRRDPVPVRACSWRLSPRNLGYRMLGCMRWSKSAVRRPGCRHVRSFSMRIFNSEPGQDMSVLSARVFFRLRGEER